MFFLSIGNGVFVLSGLAAVGALVFAVYAKGRRDEWRASHKNRADFG